MRSELDCLARAKANEGCLTLVLQQRTSALAAVRLRVEVDGQLVYLETRAEALEPRALVIAGSLPLRAGSHVVALRLELGVASLSNAPYGESGYYHLVVRSSKDVSIATGDVRALAIRTYEKGTITTPIEQRPAVAWDDVAVAP